MKKCFKIKFDLFIESGDYDNSFSWVDGFLFYDIFVELGVYSVDETEKKLVWATTVETAMVWNAGINPSKEKMINYTKSILFRNFVLRMESDIALSDMVLKNLNIVTN